MNCLQKANTVVVKVGTSTLTHPSGRLNIRGIEALVKVLADLKNAGKQLVVVSSGAIGVGVGILNLPEKPTDMPTKQACAAIGQCELMYLYDKLFGEYHHKVAQVLLTRDTVEDPVRKQHVQNTFARLLSLGVIPIVNENDTVAVEEIEFGDNDTLGAIVATLVDAELLIMMSDIDGLYDKNPREYDDAALIQTVTAITPEIRALAGGEGSSLGTGGMVTKLNAAEIAFANGFSMVLTNGQHPANLYKLLDGDKVGTYFGKITAEEENA